MSDSGGLPPGGTREGGIVDEDLDGMSREQLIGEVKKLRRGVREHRDSTGHQLCWHHPALWGLLPENTTANTRALSGVRGLPTGVGE